MLVATLIPCTGALSSGREQRWDRCPLNKNNLLKQRQVEDNMNENEDDKDKWQGVAANAHGCVTKVGHHATP